MDSRDMFLLVARAVCTLVAIASFFIDAIPSRGSAGFTAFISFKFAMFMLTGWEPMMIFVHVASLRNWADWPSDGHYWLSQVIPEWAVSILALGTGWSASAVADFLPRAHPSYVLHPEVCSWNRHLSLVLGLVAGHISVAISGVQTWATMRRRFHAV